MDKKIYFVTGASGVGKTTLLELLASKYPKLKVEHFDSIGIPSYEDMVRDYGSAEEFQRVISKKWIEKLTNKYDDEVIFFEGQVNLDFIIDGFIAINFSNYSIILIDCSEVEMEKRLIERGQPELVTENMFNWQRFLKNQAKKYKCNIVDSTKLSKDELLSCFVSLTDLNEYIKC